MLRTLPFLPETLTECYPLHNLLGLSSPMGLVTEQPLLWGNEDTDAGRLIVLQSLQLGLDQSFNNQPEVLSPTMLPSPLPAPAPWDSLSQTLVPV